MTNKIFLLLVSLFLFYEYSFHYTFAIPSSDAMYDVYKEDFIRNAQCKIPPLAKVLIAIPQERDYEKQYITGDDQILRLQCEKGVEMDIYLQTEGGIIKTSKNIPSSFPACESLTVEPVDGLYWSPRKRNAHISLREIEIFIAGTILIDPLVLTKEKRIMTGKYSLTEPTSLPPSVTRKSITIEGTDADTGEKFPITTYENTGTFPPMFNIAHLPECEPNIRLKK